MYSYDVASDFNSPNTSAGADNFSCLHFSIETTELVVRIKGSLGFITIVANLFAIFLILISKKFKETTFRLVIYLMITDILQAVAMCLALSPISVPDDDHDADVRNGTGWKDFCAATGYVLMTTMWMGNIVIIWIVLHLLVLGWRLYRVQVTIENSRNVEPINNEKNNTKCELYGVLFLLTAPLLIGMIPLFLPNQMYGISGLWCWIKIVSTSCSSIKQESLIVVFIFFYGPLILIVLFSTVSMLSTIIFVCYGAVRRHRRTFVDQHQQRMKEIMLVLAYPMLYCTVCLILLANRVYSLVHSNSPPFKPLWIAHTVADPVRVMLPAIAFLLHPYVWKAIFNRKKTKNADCTVRAKTDQSINMNGDESVEERLLNRRDNGNNVTYGAIDDDNDDDENLSLVVESK